MPTLLVVEDDPAQRTAYARLLRAEGYEVRAAASPAEALALQDGPIHLVLTDLRMGPRDGIDLLRAWRRECPDTPFLFLSAFGTVEAAVEAMKLGAVDFLTKPVRPDHLLECIRSTLGQCLANHPAVAGETLPGFEKVVGCSEALAAVCRQAARAASTSSTVLLLGESGTGKELVAEAIHRASARAGGPFVAFNIAAVPETLLESELFGHVRGAFSGAVQDRPGRFQAASGGTLLVDEVGDCPLTLQHKLLRALERQAVTPLGSNVPEAVDVRIIAATSRPLWQMLERGQFREDLFYRLNVVPLELPPLRHRREDIPPLSRHFLAEIARSWGRPPFDIDPALLRLLTAHPWPGNVRQLRNSLERMCVLASGPVLSPDDLPSDLRGQPPPGPDPASLDSLERSAILDALRQSGGNRTQAARLLGISVRTIQRKLREWERLDGQPQDPGSA